MREILYRGKRVDVVNAWAFGFYTKSPSGNTYITETVAGGAHPRIVQPDSVGQYTGAKDKNGKLIFEGDIIHVDGIANDQLAEVCFGRYATTGGPDTTHVGFFLEWKREVGLRKDFGYWAYSKRLSVIGNTYDNPELLFQEDDNEND